MQTMVRSWWKLLLVGLVVGCSSSNEPEVEPQVDAGAVADDARASDRSASDAPAADGRASNGPTGDAPAADGPASDRSASDAPAPDTPVADGRASDGRAPDAGPSDVRPAQLGEVSAQELHAALATKDFLLIDVHVPYAGTIAGTDARIPYTDINALIQFIGPDLDTNVVLTCASGHMSTTAGNTLANRGYRSIRQLTGGFAAWTTAGYSLDHDGG